MELYIVIAITHFLALLSPGPDFFLLLMTVLNVNRATAFYVNWGITIGNALILACLLLLSLFTQQLSPSLVWGVRFIGASYLIYLAILCWKQAVQDESILIALDNKNSILRSDGYYVGLGLQSSLLNPKNWMFYSSLILLLPYQTLLLSKIAISFWMIIVVLGWNSLLILLLTHPKWIAILQRRAKTIYWLSTLCFLIFAGLLIVV